MYQIFTILPKLLHWHQVTELRDRVQTQRTRLNRLADHLGDHLLFVQHQGDVDWALVGAPQRRVEESLASLREGFVLLDGEVTPAEVGASFETSQ